MKIKLDNLSDSCTAWATADEAREDQTIDGNRWEFDGDTAYAILSDRPGLLDELEAEYDVDSSEYCPLDTVDEGCGDTET